MTSASGDLSHAKGKLLGSGYILKAEPREFLLELRLCMREKPCVVWMMSRRGGRAQIELIAGERLLAWSQEGRWLWAVQEAYSLKHQVC